MMWWRRQAAFVAQEVIEQLLEAGQAGCQAGTAVVVVVGGLQWQGCEVAVVAASLGTCFGVRTHAASGNGDGHESVAIILETAGECPFVGEPRPSVAAGLPEGSGCGAAAGRWGK